jgi:hypothetical protein
MTGVVIPNEARNLRRQVEAAWRRIKWPYAVENKKAHKRLTCGLLNNLSTGYLLLFLAPLLAAAGLALAVLLAAGWALALFVAEGWALAPLSAAFALDFSFIASLCLPYRNQ